MASCGGREFPELALPHKTAHPSHLTAMFALMEGDLFLKRSYFFMERLAFPL